MMSAGSFVRCGRSLVTFAFRSFLPPLRPTANQVALTIALSPPVFQAAGKPQTLHTQDNGVVIQNTLTLGLNQTEESQESVEAKELSVDLVDNSGTSATFVNKSDPVRIVVFLGSVRDGRNGARVAKRVRDIFEKSDDLCIVVLDPLELSVPVLKQPIHFMKDQTQAPGWMIHSNQLIKEADGYILISPEYNGSYGPALSNILNYFPRASFQNKPCAFVTYTEGITAGIRAATLLRPHVSDFGMVSIPTFVGIPKVTEVLDESGNPKGEDGRKIEKKMKGLILELQWYAEALRSMKKRTPVPVTPK